MVFEGGFQGRTNKLVDGCYSFWVGALIPLIQAVEKQKIIRDDQGSFRRNFKSRRIVWDILETNIDHSDQLFDTSKNSENEISIRSCSI